MSLQQLANCKELYVGTLCMRKRRGTKLHFIMGGGMTLAEAQTYVNWDYIKESRQVVEFRGETLDGERVFVSLLPN